MALGGGTYTTQNKVLAGAYFQFVSLPTATATLSDRGTVGMGVELNWGVDGKIFDVTATEFMKDSLKIFGYAYNAPELQVLRELFLHATTLHCYKLTSGGEKAVCSYGTAKYEGLRGNDLKVVIATNVDDETQFDVTLYLGATKVFEQTVTTMAELGDNAFVDWSKSATLTITAGEAFTGGTNGTADATAHQTFLGKIESFPDTNIIAYTGTDDSIKGLYVSFAKRMRDEVGIKLQAVVHDKAGDSVACINVKNDVNLVPWVAGLEAGLAVNESAANFKYDGELEVNTDYTQVQLEKAIKAGEFVLHQVGTDVRVLDDINSLVNTSEDEGEIFMDNQTVRVIDAIATSIASVFATKYIGKVKNDASGRISLKNDIRKLYQTLEELRAIENFDVEKLVVEIGETKKSVAVNSEITVVNTMTKLYMRTVVA